jgi:hypothetical protein
MLGWDEVGWGCVCVVLNTPASLLFDLIMMNLYHHHENLASLYFEYVNHSNNGFVLLNFNFCVLTFTSTIHFYSLICRC